MEFQVLTRGRRVPDNGRNTAYLTIDNWNDYSYVTMFHMSLHDTEGVKHEVGEIKIAFKGQTTTVNTHSILPERFESLGDEFFSLGLSTDFYRKIASLSDGLGTKILKALRDIVATPELIDSIREEEVFSVSLLRGISLSTIKGQFARVLDGNAELTDFKFKFVRPETTEHFGSMDLNFVVQVASTPNTNIHAVIGRNGVGKTTLLNDMTLAITEKHNSTSKFIDMAGWSEKKIDDDYFSSLVSVCFSAFDPFSPPKEQPDPAKGTCYFYMGLKDPSNSARHRSINDLQIECAKALISCFCNSRKKERWFNAIEKLGSDENFHSMDLRHLEATYRALHNSFVRDSIDLGEFQNTYFQTIRPALENMSSGHSIVLLTITRLVATVEEKTLVLMDEPESHLHPPLLSALVRALADLLHDQNGVAIIATHSPVVLQEIPQCCVWKIYRTGDSVICRRPTLETFGENVGLLTSEVFSLEVERSGFHALLRESVNSGRTYDEILENYQGRLGLEGRTILRTLIAERDRSSYDSA